MMRLPARLASVGIACLLACLVPAVADDDLWPSIRKDVFGSRPVLDDHAVEIFAPNQADDAAVVPVSIRIDSKLAPKSKSLTLIIDRNPAPVAATFAFGDKYREAVDGKDRTLATRVRVDAFSRVRAILETADGELHMASKFVIGSGGCSAPASKDMDAALAEMGRTQMKLTKGEGAAREATVMIKHPNFTGMQMNKKTGDYTPARFVNFIEVKQGDALLFRMEGGISISEDPNIRFTFGTNSAEDLDFVAKDTGGATFKGSSRPDPS